MLCSAIFTFRVWIVPLYSVFPVVTLTQTKRKWRGDGEDEDRKVNAEDIGGCAMNLVPCELELQYK